MQIDENKYLGVHDNNLLINIMLDEYHKYMNCLDGNKIEELGNNYRQAKEVLLIRLQEPYDADEETSKEIRQEMMREPTKKSMERTLFELEILRKVRGR